jgi:bis(5'-nucleosidyl)-tetraphosphatase
MKKEYSYGAIVYRLKGTQPEILIEHMHLGHISLPKGHIEEGESPLQCTLREIKEETNLDVDVDMGFSHTITYSPQPDVNKDVTFYVAKALSTLIIPQPEEVSYAEWVSPEKALACLTFKSDKETLALALAYLSKKLKDAK